jgi:hypothetical protein
LLINGQFDWRALGIFLSAPAIAVAVIAAALIITKNISAPANAAEASLFALMHTVATVVATHFIAISVPRFASDPATRPAFEWTSAGNIVGLLVIELALLLAVRPWFVPDSKESQR